jgi:hypothetical protein
VWSRNRFLKAKKRIKNSATVLAPLSFHSSKNMHALARSPSMNHLPADHFANKGPRSQTAFVRFFICRRRAQLLTRLFFTHVHEFVRTNFSIYDFGAYEFVHMTKIDDARNPTIRFVKKMLRLSDK